MIVRRILLKNFRNYESLDLSFPKGVILISGQNAQGKTNLLESILVAGTGKSHRETMDKNLIRFGEEEAHIKLFYEDQGREDTIDIHLKKNRPKGIAISSKPIRKMEELFGKLPMVLFSPEDLRLVKDGPSGRRRFLDRELCLYDPLYYYHYKKYHKVLQERNTLLRMMDPDKNLLTVYDEQLSQHGEEILRLREVFLTELGDILREIHSSITKDPKKISVHPVLTAKRGSFLQTLRRSLKRDLQTGSTNMGPHRDDISFLLGDMDLRSYGSQGQQRSMALALKLSEMEWLKKRFHREPLLLLDDVLSELDENRQIALLEYGQKNQTILTCAGSLDLLKKEKILSAHYTVCDGKICDAKAEVKGV